MSAPAGAAPAFARALRDFVRRALGSRARVTGCERISARLSPVYRVTLAGPEAGSVIVKRLGDAWFGDMRCPAAPPEFREEIAAYRYLEALAHGFPRRPRLLGVDDAGMLMLEDLGQGDTLDWPFDAVGAAVVELLADLHAATWGRTAPLAAERAALGLGDDLRYDGALAARHWYGRGTRAIAGWCEALGVMPAARMDDLAGRLAEAIDDPAWTALLHEDLANARQCIQRDGSLWLIDLEAAKPGHALRDLARVMLGKYERDLDNGRMVWINPGFPPAIVAAYRRRLASHGRGIDAESWERGLADAMLHALVTQCGSLIEHVETGRVTGDLLPNLAAMVKRLDLVLGPLAQHDPLRHALAALARGIAAP